jgi:hypothetical protein
MRSLCISSLEKINAGLLMSCVNTKKIRITRKGIIIDCPSCDFKCGFSKNKQRRKLNE